MEQCQTCRHDDHKPGQCKQCNCGQSEICHLTGVREITVTWGQWPSSMTGYGYDMGHRVERKKGSP